MLNLRYETDRLTDLEITRSIADRVNRFFGDSNLMDEVQRSLPGDAYRGAGVITKTYHYNGVSAIVRDFAFTEWNTPRGEKVAVQTLIGIVSCKVAGDNKRVMDYIATELEKIDGLKKDNINNNLPY